MQNMGQSQAERDRREAVEMQKEQQQGVERRQRRQVARCLSVMADNGVEMAEQWREGAFTVAGEVDAMLEAVEMVRAMAVSHGTTLNA